MIYTIYSCYCIGLSLVRRNDTDWKVQSAIAVKNRHFSMGIYKGDISIGVNTADISIEIQIGDISV